MIRKELATAIGLSVALSVTGCGNTSVVVEEPKTDAVEEVKEEKDSTAPKLKSKDKIEPVDLGAEIIASEYVEVEDDSDVSVYFVAEDGDVLTLDIPKELDSDTKEIDYTVVAVDALGNRSDEIIVTIPIIVSEETAKEETQEKEENTGDTPDYIIEPCEDTTYYAIQTCNVRSGPSTEYDAVRQLAPNEEIIVNGRVKAPNGKNWCVIKTSDGSTQMVSGSLISKEKIATKKPSNNSGSTNPSTGTTNPAPSDCSVADCESDCEGYCSADCFSDWNPSDCEASYCSGSYCAAAE
ncbi:MAG: SH3 domain-containing protein [Lachnospiraceae bacterium]|nr:SH3 domain-containing protein [Lachnospiraceae bacterium]